MIEHVIFELNWYTWIEYEYTYWIQPMLNFNFSYLRFKNKKNHIHSLPRNKLLKNNKTD